MTEWRALKQVADEMGVTPQTVRNWVMDGKLTGYRFGKGNLRILESDLQEFIERSKIHVSDRVKELAD